MATTELTVIDTWIYSTLAADVATTAIVSTRIYEDVNSQQDEQGNPIPTVYPCIVFAQQSARPDLMAVGAIRVWSEGLYLIQAIAQTNSYGGNLEALARRIDVLFHDVRGNVSGGAVISSVRQQPFKLREFTNGRTYRHLGGLYEIKAQVS